jgi:glycosyltransferase involved in cell wall biosynthesis
MTGRNSDAESRPPRVLHIVSTTAFAGIERHVVRLAGALARSGCEVAIAAPSSAERLRTEASATDVPVYPDADLTRRWALGAAGAVRSVRPDAIHVHEGRGALLGSLLAVHGRTPLIRTQHFTRTASALRRGWGRSGSLAAHRLVNKSLAGYIAVSQAVLDAARARGELGVVPTAVISPGIPIAPMLSVEAAEKARTELGYPVIAFMGRLERERRVDLLLDAIPAVLRDAPNCRFLIAGSGKDEDRLQQQARRLGVDGVVSWLGWVSEPDALFERSHLFVNTLAEEGFGMAMAEAMAYGLPVIAPAAGSNPEVVDNGVTGLLVQPNDAPDLARSIVRLSRDLNFAAELGRRGRGRAAASFGVDRTASATRDFYVRVLGPLR